ncbi:hypothetical protein [Streptomyces lienomycini]|uniref:Lipoprotein n=1 Tax=Streptomyces lienomycini TaxID=284035 RepID=A0ABV9WY29_9ACTN
MTWATAKSTASTASTGSTASAPSTASAASVVGPGLPSGGVPRRRGRRSVRAAVPALGLVGALALTACTDGGGSDDGGSGGDAKPSATSGASASTDPGEGTGGTGGSPSAAGGLEGSWLATTGGQAVALVVTGDKAGLFATGGTVCSGTASEQSGTRTIRLTCNDGNDDRANGEVRSVGATTLEVTWEGGLGEETYTRSEGGSMPPGLPTAGLGS